MAKFSYKTRNDVEPTKLQKIWLCAHPDDVDSFLENDANIIHSLVNCAIWYDKTTNENIEHEELLENLNDMKLFVVPVTYKFLSEENRALSIELPYAVKNNIPILPLIKDTALTNLFNEKCGYIQYLSLESEDELTNSYNEKLKKYILTTLLTDETTKRIRSAFDAYIFLSYRKKDKKYANQLMRLIHQNEFCRDIAIWYDEFLTPGENFNEEISSVIEKSRIFALAVTPNILEENNYVLTQEYPLAMKTGLNILPAEMVKTDEKELRKKYPNIPELTNAYDNEVLSPALLNALSDIAIRTNDDDPVHNFLIGLAYLGGIDLEVDRKRAYELIEDSSSKGLLEATMKLIDMYKYGDGVERSFENAISMANRLILQAKELYLKDDSEENFKQYIYAFNELTTLLIEQKQYKKAIEVCDSNYLIIKESLNKFNKEINFYYFDILVKKGWYLYQTKDYEGAKLCYEEYLFNASTYLENNTYLLQVNKIRISIALVEVLHYKGDFAAANKLLLEVENAILMISDDMLDDGYILQIMKSYYTLANLMRIKKQYEKSLKYYNKMNECYLRIKNKLSIEEQLKYECMYYDSVANIFYITNDIEESEKNYEISHNLAIEYYQKTGHLMSKEKIANSYLNKANIAMIKSEFDNAKENFGIALVKFKEISAICNSFYSIAKQDIIYNKLSIIAENDNLIEESINYTKDRITCLKKHIEKKNDMVSSYMIATAYSDYALLLKKYNKQQEAYYSCINASKYFEIACSTNDALLIYAARSYKIEGDFATKIGLHQNAINSYEKSFDYYMQCVVDKDDIFNVIYLCEELAKEANVEDAFGYYNVALRYCDRLLKDNPNDDKLLHKRNYIAKKHNELWGLQKKEESTDDLEDIINSVFD